MGQKKRHVDQPWFDKHKYTGLRLSGIGPDSDYAQAGSSNTRSQMLPPLNKSIKPDSPNHEQEIDAITRSSSQMGTRNTKRFDIQTPQISNSAKRNLDLNYHRAYFSRNGTGQKIPLKPKPGHMEGGEQMEGG